jgi:hypothetical protein
MTKWPTPSLGKSIHGVVYWHLAEIPLVLENGRFKRAADLRNDYAMSVSGPRPILRKDLTSAFGTKGKWPARQSQLPRSKMTHSGHPAG